jgi:hypothetical protein
LDLLLVDAFFFGFDAFFCFPQLLLALVKPLVTAASFGLRWQAIGFFLPFCVCVCVCVCGCGCGWSLGLELAPLGCFFAFNWLCSLVTWD